MPKRNLHGGLQPSDPSTSRRKRQKKEVCDKPWEAAKGDIEIKFVDVLQEEKEPVFPPSQNLGPQASTYPMVGNSSSKRINTRASVSKLEFVSQLSSQHSVSKELDEETDWAKRKSSPNETLVSLDSKSGTEDKSSTTPNMSITSDFSGFKFQNTPSSGCGKFVNKRGRLEEIQRTTSSDFLHFMCPVSSSIKKTPSQGNGVYLRTLISSPLLVTEECTPVDQPVTKTSMKDIKERLMADRLMQAENRLKQKKNMVFSTSSELPVTGRILLPEPPVNRFLKNDEDEKSKSFSNKRPRKNRKSGYGSSKLLMDYKVLKKIGSGEFGTVHAVVSRYDGYVCC